jgi:small neutral amino acid transporter SnatA (MarC family)
VDAVLDSLRFGLACFVAVFTIVNPFSAAGLLVALTPGQSTPQRRGQVTRAVAFMRAIMIVTYVAGVTLRFFSVSQLALVSLRAARARSSTRHRH